MAARYGDAEETFLREKVAQALQEKGLTLASYDRVDEEIAVYDDLLSRFGNAAEASIRPATVARWILSSAAQRAERVGKLPPQLPPDG